MHDRFIRQAYEELAHLRERLSNAEEKRIHSGDLRRRVAESEARIRALEWAAWINR